MHAQEPDTSFLTDELLALHKGRKHVEGVGGECMPKLSLDHLLQQLVLAHTEWLKFQGLVGSDADTSALERAVRDRTVSATAVAEMVTAGA